MRNFLLWAFPYTWPSKNRVVTCMNILMSLGTMAARDHILFLISVGNPGSQHCTLMGEI